MDNAQFKILNYDVVVIGAGPAGLMAAIQSCELGTNVLVLEKMHKPALKLRISGKGRCNITNNAEHDELKEVEKLGPKIAKKIKEAVDEEYNKD